MSNLVLALLIGAVAGLRTFMAPAAVSWAAHLGWIGLEGSFFAFMGYAFTPYVFTALAMVELVTDQLPMTPSRTVPVQFAARILSAALSGACLGAAAGSAGAGAIAAVVGAVIGTLGGAALRSRLAAAFGKDRPAALIEDAIAILAAWIVVSLA